MRRLAKSPAAAAMTPALVYGCAADEALPARERLLHANVEAALRAHGSVDSRSLDDVGRGGRLPAAARPGLVRIGPDERILAVGCRALVALADYGKCTLLGGRLDLHADEPDRSDEGAIDGLLWACLNTRRAVVLGRSAWQAAQMLPFPDRRFHAVPPLRWRGPRGRPDPERILIIDHEEEGAVAANLRAALSPYARVEVVDRCGGHGWPASDLVPCEAAVHIHVGEHTMAAEEPRLVEGWVNRVPVLHYRPRRTGPARPAPEEPLDVHHGANGFRCRNPGEVLATLDDLRSDRVLRARIVEEGLRTVAPLVASWKAIADDLLSG